LRELQRRQRGGRLARTHGRGVRQLCVSRTSNGHARRIVHGNRDRCGGRAREALPRRGEKVPESSLLRGTAGLSKGHVVSATIAQRNSILAATPAAVGRTADYDFAHASQITQTAGF